MRLAKVLGALFLLAVVGDSLTTYLALTTPSATIMAYEANPLARYLFETLGLEETLVLDFFVSVAALSLVFCLRIAYRWKVVILSFFVALTAAAVANNTWVLMTGDFKW